MTLKNRKLHKLEAGVPGVPHIRHLEMHAACDRFLASRGLATGSPFRRKSAWLYGAVTAERRSA
jgi:hypothetical protein